MSSTRHADEGAPLKQCRYASSAEYDRGLIASLVARRLSVVESSEDRQLIWALQFLSNRIGTKAMAREILEKHGDPIGTLEMVRIGKRQGCYNADEVRKIRLELPDSLRPRFILQGETIEEICCQSGQLSRQARIARTLRYLEIANGEREEIEAQRSRKQEGSQKKPMSFPVESLLAVCRQAAEGFEEWISELCLDPSKEINTATPWYFARAFDVLKEFVQNWISERSAGAHVTAIGEKISETLEFTLVEKGMSLIEGNARIGKSHAAKSWCEQHPGQARFIEVPTGNDDSTFFRALARGLGIGNFSQAKALEIRERVESVLLSGDLLLCLDEGHRLFPESGIRFGFPKRIAWAMSMANQGVPICMVATPQFLGRLKATEQHTGWQAAQLLGRVREYVPLAKDLSLNDLMAVAKIHLPEADTTTLKALAAYARTSARYLAAIEAITARARFTAGRCGRNSVTTEDVRHAMAASVIPADSNLVRALAAVDKPRRISRRAEPLGDLGSEAAAPMQPPAVGQPHFRNVQPAPLPTDSGIAV